MVKINHSGPVFQVINLRSDQLEKRQFQITELHDDNIFGNAGRKYKEMTFLS